MGSWTASIARAAMAVSLMLAVSWPPAQGQGQGAWSGSVSQQEAVTLLEQQLLDRSRAVLNQLDRQYETGIRVSPESRNILDRALANGARRLAMDLSNCPPGRACYGPSPVNLSEAQRALARSEGALDELIRTALQISQQQTGRPALSEGSISAALNRLCPLYPFC